jgi:hypothetical protein
MKNKRLLLAPPYGRGCLACELREERGIAAGRVAAGRLHHPRDAQTISAATQKAPSWAARAQP